MARLAFFTPIPPDRSGIAAYSSELIPLLATNHGIDVFTDQKPSRPTSLGHPGLVNLRSAHDFLWSHAQAPYELIIYQLGNAQCHDFMWPYLVRYPGLVVLHDIQLHHARARALLERHNVQEYCEEFAWNHPDADPRIADLFAEGLGGSLHYHWPMHRTVVCSARLVGVHNSHVARELSERYTDLAIRSIRMGVAAPPESTTIDRRPGIRERHGIPEDALLFSAFGLITPEKRIGHAIEAVAWLHAEIKQVYLMLVGDSVPHYDARADALRAGISDRIRVTGYVPEKELYAYIDAADVCLCLRWPSSRETSASWLRCLAAGKATVTTDLEHTADEPVMDPRSWAVLGNQPPAAVRVDLLDEDHSLRLAVRRLAREPDFRKRLGASGRTWWASRHTLQHMHEDYEKVIEEAIRAPGRECRLPAHLRRDGLENLRALLKPFALDSPF